MIKKWSTSQGNLGFKSLHLLQVAIISLGSGQSHIMHTTHKMPVLLLASPDPLMTLSRGISAVQRSAHFY